MRKSEKKWEKVGKSIERWLKVGKSWGKWPPAAILDDRKSLSIAVFAISDQYTTLFFSFF